MVIRRPEPTDGRFNRIYLTAKGRKIQFALIPLAKENVVWASDGISDNDMKIAKTVLGKVIGKLNHTFLALLVSVHPEIALFRKLGVNLRN